MTTARRGRLAPETFQLPVEKMRDGYYSDAYFTFTRDVLEADDHRPDVLMQVFQRERSVLGGVDEAIAILKLCSGRRLPDGSWEAGWDRLEVAALHDGDEIEPWETVLTIRGDYSLFASLETLYLGVLARRTLISRNVRDVVAAAGGKPISTSRPASTTGRSRPATAGRRTSPGRSACRRTRRRRGGGARGWARSRTA
jgi:nicotinate phosphoribosyltransferase